jgi:hypothetical protein
LTIYTIKLIFIEYIKWREMMKSLIIKGFPEDLHREMKIQAAVEGTTIKELVIQAVKDYLKKKKK